MTDLDERYLERRRQESLAKAESAQDPGIAQVHRDFAGQYERELAGRPVKLFVVRDQPVSVDSAAAAAASADRRA